MSQIQTLKDSLMLTAENFNDFVYVIIIEEKKFEIFIKSGIGFLTAGGEFFNNEILLLVTDVDRDCYTLYTVKKIRHGKHSVKTSICLLEDFEGKEKIYSKILEHLKVHLSLEQIANM